MKRTTIITIILIFALSSCAPRQQISITNITGLSVSYSVNGAEVTRIFSDAESRDRYVSYIREMTNGTSAESLVNQGEAGRGD